MRDGDGWVLNGAKTFTTNGHYADVCVAMAVTDTRKARHGISAFIVEKGTPGFRPGKKENKLGHARQRHLRSDFQRLPRARGKSAGQGRRGIRQQLCRFSTAGESRSPRWRWGWRRALRGRHAIREAAQAVRQAISEFQAIQFKLADMATEIRAARLLVYRAAWLADRSVSRRRPLRFTRESSMAKLYASEVAVRVANEAVQIFGGYGFIKDYPVEKFYRDVKLCTIGEGTSEIQRLVIARQILGKP